MKMVLEIFYKILYITLRNKCSCFIYRTLTWGTCVLLPHPVSPTSTSVWNFSSRYRIWFLFLNTGSLSRCCSKDSDTLGLYTKAVAQFGSMSDLSSSHVLLSPINKGIKLPDALFQNWGDTVNLKYIYWVWDSNQLQYESYSGFFFVTNLVMPLDHELKC